MRRHLSVFAVILGVLITPGSSFAGELKIDVPGTILEARGASGELWMVVEETVSPERTCGLFMADASETSPAVRVRDTACSAVLSRLEPADGAAAIVVATGPGLTLTTTGEFILTDPDLERVRIPDRFVQPGGFCLATLGELHCLAVGPGFQALPSGSAKLPVVARRSAMGLTLRSPTVDVVRGTDGVFATRPEARGSSRLLVHLITFEPEGSTVSECWLRLPAAERVHEAWFRLINGKPHVILTTSRSDKLQLFAEKLLRIFPLKPDRTRQGFPPIFAIETELNLWQSGELDLTDTNGDGIDDLVLAYWKGLRKARISVDVYLGINQTWKRKARSTGIAFAEAERWFLDVEHDFNGDGLGDLVVLAEDRVQVIARRVSSKGKNIFADEAFWTSEALPKREDQMMTISASPGGVAAEQSRDNRLIFDDVDDDGQVEILLSSGRTLTVFQPGPSDNR